MTDATQTEVPATEQDRHVGYAAGATTLDHATLRGAVSRLLATHDEVAVKTPDGRVSKQRVHETDPPEEFQAKPRLKKPGPLPELVDVASIQDGAKTLRLRNSTPAHSAGLDHTCYHLARFFVVQARLHHAKQLALLSPVLENDVYVTEAVLVF